LVISFYNVFDAEVLGSVAAVKRKPRAAAQDRATMGTLMERVGALLVAR
jgi:hypothetical protein